MTTKRFRNWIIIRFGIALPFVYFFTTWLSQLGTTKSPLSVTVGTFIFIALSAYYTAIDYSVWKRTPDEQR